MELFQHLNITNFSIFLTKRAIFAIFWHLFFLIQVFPDTGARKTPKGLKISYWQIFIGRAIDFQLFNVTNVSKFLIKVAFWKFLSFFRFFQSQEPRNILKGLKIGYCIIFRCNGISCNVLASWTSALFDNFCHFFPIFGIYSFIVIIQVFWALRVGKPPLAFNYKLLENFSWPWINGLIFKFLLSQVKAFFR